MNLIEGLQQEIKRVQGIIEIYEQPELNGAGKFAVAMMKDTIRRAERNIAGYSDVVESLQIYHELTEYHV